MNAQKSGKIPRFSHLLSASGKLLLLTVATESSDGFQRYLRSTQVNKLEGKVRGRFWPDGGTSYLLTNLGRDSVSESGVSQSAFSSSLSHSLQKKRFMLNSLHVVSESGVKVISNL